MLLTVVGGVVQCAPTSSGIHLVDALTGGEELLDRIQITVFGSQMEPAATLVLSTMVLEQRHQIAEPLVISLIQRGALTGPIGDIDVSSVFQQQLHDFALIVFHRGDERRIACGGIPLVDLLSMSANPIADPSSEAGFDVAEDACVHGVGLGERVLSPAEKKTATSR